MSKEFLTKRAVDVDLISISEMFESTPSCLKVISKDGLLLHMNPQGLNLIEAENMASVYQANVYDLLEESHREKFIAFNQSVCAGNKEFLTFEIIGLKGGRRWMESYAAPYRLPSGELAHIAITNDITDRVAADNKILMQRQALESSARLASLGQFVGGVAHEINNPLSIISGKLTLLDMSLDRDIFEKKDFKEKLSEVIETTDRITQIIRNLKTFSRDPDKDAFECYKMSEIIEETVSLCAEKFRVSDIKFDCLVEPALLVECQKVQISQVLMNLLNNAFDAIAGGHARWIKIHGHCHGNTVRVTVTDSGEGMPREVAEQIFNPFYTTKEVGSGTGLGLSISAGIATQHGGSLYYNSSHLNTQFVLELPLNREGK